MATLKSSSALLSHFDVFYCFGFGNILQFICCRVDAIFVEYFCEPKPKETAEEEDNGQVDEEA